MTKLCNKNRRESTMVRDNEIHELYQQIRHELGNLVPMRCRKDISTNGLKKRPNSAYGLSRLY